MSPRRRRRSSVQESHRKHIHRTGDTAARANGSPITSNRRSGAAIRNRRQSLLPATAHGRAPQETENEGVSVRSLRQRDARARSTFNHENPRAGQKLHREIASPKKQGRISRL